MAPLPERFTKLREEGKHFKQEILERTLTYVVGAFGLVAGLAWNEAIKGLIEFLVPLEQESILIKFIYAFVMTIVLVLVTVYLVRLFDRTNNDGKPQ